MSKKNLVFGLFAVALTLGIVSVAAAASPSQADLSSALSSATLAPTGAAIGAGLQDPPNPPGPRGGPGRGPFWEAPHVGGEITAMGEEQFTLTTEGNLSFSIDVTDLTSYLGSLESFSHLQVGLDVVVAGHRSGEGTFTARVIIARDDMPLGIPFGGEVTAIGSDTLTIQTRRGETLTFDVTTDTDFLSRDNNVTSLSDIEVGDHVLVLFEQATSGGLTANVILVGETAPVVAE